MRPFDYRRVDDANALHALQRRGTNLANAAFLAGAPLYSTS